MNFIYGGGEKWSFKFLNAVLIFPVLTHKTQTQPKFEEFKGVMLKWNRCKDALWGRCFTHTVCVSWYCTFYHLFVWYLYAFWSPPKWLYQSNMVTCQLPWKWLIHQKCDTSRLFSILEMPYLCQIIQMMILYIWSHLLICADFIKVIVPVTNVGASLPLPSRVSYQHYIMTIWIHLYAEVSKPLL